MGIGTEPLPEVSSPFLSSEVSFGSLSFASNNADKNKQGRLKKDQKKYLVLHLSRCLRKSVKISVSWMFNDKTEYVRGK